MGWGKKSYLYFQVFLNYFYKLCNSPFPKDLGVWGVSLSRIQVHGWSCVRMLCLTQNLSSLIENNKHGSRKKAAWIKQGRLRAAPVCHLPCKALFSGAAQLFLATFYTHNQAKARLCCQCEGCGCAAVAQRNSQGRSQPTGWEHRAALSDTEWQIVWDLIFRVFSNKLGSLEQISSTTCLVFFNVQKLNSITLQYFFFVWNWSTVWTPNQILRQLFVKFLNLLVNISLVLVL